MKITVLGRKVTGIIMAAMIAVSAVAVSASAQSEYITAENAVAREIDAQEWELVDPTSMTDANATAGGQMKLMVSFTEALAEGYEIQINFTTASGMKKTFTASTQKPPMQTNYSCIPIRDIFDKLGLGGETLTSVTFTGKSADKITNIQFVTGPAGASAAAAGSGVQPSSGTTVPAASTGEENPATGVDDLVLPVALTCVFGTAAVAVATARKRK